MCGIGLFQNDSFQIVRSPVLKVMVEGVQREVIAPRLPQITDNILITNEISNWGKI